MLGIGSCYQGVKVLIKGVSSRGKNVNVCEIKRKITSYGMHFA